MQIPPSPHFTPVPLTLLFNHRREQLDTALQPIDPTTELFGLQNLQGIPFRLGSPDQPNVLLLDRS